MCLSFEKCVFCVIQNVFFSLNPTYACLFSDGQMTSFIGFSDGAHLYTLNLASTAWVLYSPTSELVSSGGVLLGPSTNNLAKYQAMVGLLTEALDFDVREIRVYLDSELVVQQLNRVYTIRSPYLLCTFQRVRLLERYFEQVMYHHILIQLNAVEDSLAYYVLDWHIAHT